MDEEQAARRPGVLLVDPGKRWVFSDRQVMESTIGAWALAEYVDRDLMGKYQHLRLSVETRQALATLEAANAEARRKVSAYSFVEYGVRGMVSTQLADLVISTVGAMLDTGVAMEHEAALVQRAARRAATIDAKARAGSHEGA
jgi:hypothetical protein